MGDRAFGGLDVRGIAHIEYVVQVQTTFEEAGGAEYSLNAIAGTAKSDVQVRVAFAEDGGGTPEWSSLAPASLVLPEISLARHRGDAAP